MSTKKISKFTIAVIFIIFLIIYYYFDLETDTDIKIFLTISTFLFSIFAGFFISRQNKRYSDLRSQISNFDGGLSAIYRTSGHLGKQSQKEIGKILKNHYRPILENKKWDYYFTHKTSTLTSIHNVFEKNIGKAQLTSLPNTALNRIVASLQEIQKTRKSLITLHREKIPNFQWTLLGLLTIILLIALSGINSQFLLIPALTKAIFASSLIAVLFILYQLDKLVFFKGMIGEKSAQDVIDIIDDKK